MANEGSHRRPTLNIGVVRAGRRASRRSHRTTSVIGGVAAPRSGLVVGADREFVGQRNISVTANRYTHVLTDETEVDYTELGTQPQSTSSTPAALNASPRER